jgi:hypothetical protein
VAFYGFELFVEGFGGFGGLTLWLLLLQLLAEDVDLVDSPGDFDEAVVHLLG